MQQYDDGKDDRMSNLAAKHADEALRITLARRSSPKGCVHHSDHGAQYASLPLPKTMREHVEVVCNRARIHTAPGDLSPAEFEEANWPGDEGRQEAA